MKRMMWLIAAIFIIAAAGFFAVTFRSKNQILTFEGFGPIRPGMTFAEAEAALGKKLTPLNPNDEVYTEACWFTERADGVDPAVAYMVMEDRIVRIDVFDNLDERKKIHPRISTALGIKIGSSEDEVKTAYGSQLAISTHPYGDEPNDHYMRVLTDDKAHGLLFETWDGKVTSFRIGTAQAIEFAEGCS